ncbi:DUF551 domain-containing protein [Actinobacillus pleuropneumoniae]|uniref:DUF551 domain-containing protein n=1 Tax=Actinobacillus pleuropneumoniae TaxID=715 RepID=UPI001F328171|nr:DUF551 domain-containing protein [Actinobacillus pleuropneumoniae]
MENVNNGWISVKDRLPDEGVEVLIYILEVDEYVDRNIDIAFLNEEKQFQTTVYFFDISEVLCWQPLPLPPMKK